MRLWLSEATGHALPKKLRLAYVAPFIHVFDPDNDGSQESMVRVKDGKCVIEPRGFKMVERYDVQNTFGECEDEIPLSESPLAKVVHETSPS